MNVTQRKTRKIWKLRNARRWVRLVFSMPLLAAMVACVNLKQKYVAVVGYALETGRPEAAAAAKREGVILKLRPLRVAPMFEGRKLVYRLNSGTWSSDYYHEFFVDPAPMITGLLQEWLTASNQFEVVQGASYVPATHYIEGTVLEIYGDYKNPEAPLGVISIDLLALADTRGAPPRIVLHKTYREEAALAGGEPKQLVDGWNEALGKIFETFDRDLSAALAQP